jgi:hypothetical protein
MMPRGQFREAFPIFGLLKWRSATTARFAATGEGVISSCTYSGATGTASRGARVHEAVNTEADVLAVACPKCLLMLEDAVKAEEIEDRIVVNEISKIIEGASKYSLRDGLKKIKQEDKIKP